MQIDVTKESNSSGSDFMNSYHTNLTSEVINNLINGHYSVGEHLFNIEDKGKVETNEISPSEIYKTATGIGGLNHSIRVNDTTFEKMLSGTTLSNPEEMLGNRFNKFSRYGYLDPAHEFITGAREFVFFSKPDLHLMTASGDLYPPLSSNAFLVEAYNHYRYSFYSLQQYFGESKTINKDSSVGVGTAATFSIKNKYIPLLSNMITSSLDLSDITASDVENNRNLYQVNTTYREGSLSSDLQFDFSTEFKDTKYLDVYMLFKIYDEYCRHKYYAEIEPNRPEYILSKIYPEAMSIWKVIVDDSDRVIYWAKAIGCTPMSVPRGTISNLEGTVKFTINWKAQFIKDMDPINLLELNYLTRNSGTYHSSGLSAYRISDNETWVGFPYIVSDGNHGVNTLARTGEVANSDQKFYKLIWIK